MTNLHAQHSKGWSGLAFVVLLIVAIALGGVPPFADADPAAVGAYLTSHREGVLTQAWLTLPLSAFVLWFVVGLAAYLRLSADRDDGLPTYTLIAGTFASIAAWAGAVLVGALAAAPPSGSVLSFMWALQSYVNGPFLAMPLTIMSLAAAHSMRRHASGPAWLIWLGYASALAQALTSFGLFHRTSMPLDNPLLGLVLLAVWALWIVGASIQLIRAVPAPK